MEEKEKEKDNAKGDRENKGRYNRGHVMIAKKRWIH